MWFEGKPGKLGEDGMYYDTGYEDIITLYRVVMRVQDQARDTSKYMVIK